MLDADQVVICCDGCSLVRAAVAAVLGASEMAYTTRRAQPGMLVYENRENRRVAVLSDTYLYLTIDQPRPPYEQFEIRKYIQGILVETVRTNNPESAALSASTHVEGV